MSKVLAIDYGKSKIGLAIGDSKSRLAEPLLVIRFKSEGEAIEKIKQVVEEIQGKKVSRVVVGISEGDMAEETRLFVRQLRKKLRLPVIFQDETLTTQEARRLALRAGIKRKRRKGMEDAYAATLILQSYLDSKLTSVK